MIKPAVLSVIACALFSTIAVLPSHGQANAPVTAAATATAEFDSSYRASEVVSSRLRRSFLDSVRWSVGAEARDQLAESFAERTHTEIWQELVAADDLTTGNVADALTAYWVLNWVTANGAYSHKVDNAPVQRQLREALASDPNFLALNDQARQRMAEGYMLNFLLEHAALNDAVARQDTNRLRELAIASVARFRQQMGVDLVSLVPGPEGFVPAVAETSPQAR